MQSSRPPGNCSPREHRFHGTTLSDITSAAGESPAATSTAASRTRRACFHSLAQSFLHDMVCATGPAEPEPAGAGRTTTTFFTTLVTGYCSMFKQNIGIMITVARLATTRPAPIRRSWDPVQATRHGHRRRLRAAIPDTGLRCRTGSRSPRSSDRVSVRELHHIFVGTSGLVRQDERRQHDRHAVEDLKEDAATTSEQGRLRSSASIFTLPDRLPVLLAESIRSSRQG